MAEGNVSARDQKQTEKEATHTHTEAGAEQAALTFGTLLGYCVCVFCVVSRERLANCPLGPTEDAPGSASVLHDVRLRTPPASLFLCIRHTRGERPVSSALLLPFFQCVSPVPAQTQVPGCYSTTSTHHARLLTSTALSLLPPPLRFFHFHPRLASLLCVPFFARSFHSWLLLFCHCSAHPLAVYLASCARK